MFTGSQDSVWTEKLPPICPRCGYNLQGLPAPRCPECGTEYMWAQLRQTARRVYHDLQQVEDVNDLVRAGYFPLPLGISALLVLHLAGWSGVGRIVAFFAGLISLGLGLQVLRTYRPPAWAAAFVRTTPRYGAGAILAVLSAGLMALAIFLP